jgi:hypothetical protein
VIAHSSRARVAYALTVAVSALLLTAQRSGLPSGRELVQRHVAAIGGEEAFKSITSLRLRGRFEMPAQNISAEFEQLSARPNKMLMRAEIPGVGHTEQGFDGTTAWMIDPQMGPRVLKERERDETLADAEFDGSLLLPGHVKELTTLGRATFDGKQAFRVKVVLASGVEQEEFFDVESALRLGWEARRATPLGIVPTTATFRDYKRFGAIQHPTILVQKALFIEQLLRVTSIEYNVVRSNAFDPPPQIKALLK